MRYVWLKHSLPAGITLVCVAVASGCSLASNGDNKTIRIAVPNNAQAQSIKAGTMSSLPPPTSMSDFSCFGINVSGSGIPLQPGLQCAADVADAPALMGGLIPATGGVIELDVPAGPARRVQLIGVRSADGTCPNLQTLFQLRQQMKPGDPDPFSNLGEPYLLADATTDIFSDTTVVLHAAFDPNNPKRIFQGCGDDGFTIPLTSATKGEFTTTASTPQQYPDTSMFVSGSTATLTNPVAFTAAELSIVNTYKDPAPQSTTIPAYDTTNSVIYDVAGTAATTGHRAAIQLQWDVTNYDMTKYPAIDLQLEHTGGYTGTCSGISTAGTRSGFLTSVNDWYSSFFMLNSASGNQDSYYAPTSIPSPAKVLYVTQGTSKSIIVNIESNVFAQGTGCSSRVVLEGVRLKLIDQPKAISLSFGWNFSPPYLAGQGMGFFVYGGVPPFTMTSSGGGTINQTTRIYTPPSVATDTITITDAQNSTATFTIPITGFWTQSSTPMLVARRGGTATPLTDGRVFIAGGVGTPAANSSEFFDPSGGAFSAGPNMSYGRAWHTATLLTDGRVLLVGGQFMNTTTFRNNAEFYDPASNTFSNVPGSLTSPRAQHSSTLLPNGNVLIVGGVDGTSGTPAVSGGSDIFVSGSSLAAGPNLTAGRYAHTATLLSNGNVVIIGGLDSSSAPMSSVEIFNGSSFVAGGSLQVPRASHTATLLPNGKILIVGGVGTGSVPTTSVELYDPSTLSSTLLSPTLSPHANHQAFQLPNGKVLIVGGYSSVSVATSASEIYDPATSSVQSTFALPTARTNAMGAFLNGVPYLFGGYDGTSDLSSYATYQ